MQDATAEFKIYAFVFADRVHAMSLKLCDDVVDGVGANAVVAQARLHPKGLEKGAGMRDCGVDARFRRAAINLLYPARVLQQFVVLHVAPQVEQVR